MIRKNARLTLNKFSKVKRDLFQKSKRYIDFFIIYIFKFIFKNKEAIANKSIVFYLPKFYSNNQTDTSVDYFQILIPLQKYLSRKNSGYDVNIIFHDFLGPFSSIPQLRFLNNKKPEIIIFGSFGPKDYRMFGISPGLISKLKKHGYITSNLINIGWDTISSDYWTSNRINEYMDKVLIVDNPAKLNVPSNLDDFKYFFLPPPLFIIDTSIHDDERAFDFSFVGSVGSYRNYRSSYIAELKKINKKFIILDTTSRTQQVSRDEYFKILTNSKISINFSGSVGGFSQLKARVWETLLSGALLLEDSNSQINQYFLSDVHFVSFSTEQELVEKIDFYLNNEDLRKSIASAGQKRALELLECDLFFDTIFEPSSE